MQVKAKELGYYGDLRRKPGVVFEISDEKIESGPKKGQLKHFSSKWMEPVGKAPAAEQSKETPESSDEPNSAPAPKGKGKGKGKKKGKGKSQDVI